MGGLDQFDCEVLEQAEREGSGLTPAEYLRRLEDQAAQLKACRDPEQGIELNTIHGSKGRQWPHVILVACEEGTLPHKRSLEVSPEDAGRGDGLEAERRLAYVAFTRAQQLLEIHHDTERPSRFLVEAGLIEATDEPSRKPRRPPPVPGLAPADGSPVRGLLRQIFGG
jgi:ATP-dependent DNA helicase Rep